MNFPTIIMGIFALYLIYYTLMFLYDAFLTKGTEKEEREQEITFASNEAEELPQEVKEDLEHSYTPSEKKKLINPILIANDAIEMEVESQGFPFEQLMQEGKGMFASINY